MPPNEILRQSETSTPLKPDRKLDVLSTLLRRSRVLSTLRFPHLFTLI